MFNVGRSMFDVHLYINFWHFSLLHLPSQIPFQFNYFLQLQTLSILSLALGILVAVVIKRLRPAFPQEIGNGWRYNIPVSRSL